jgi:ABC-type branched-subunit amino acid transport system permease subunit
VIERNVTAAGVFGPVLGNPFVNQLQQILVLLVLVLSNENHVIWRNAVMIVNSLLGVSGSPALQLVALVINPVVVSLMLVLLSVLVTNRVSLKPYHVILIHALKDAQWVHGVTTLPAALSVVGDTDTAHEK